MQISAKHALKLAIGAAALVGAAQANAFTAFQTSGPQSDELIIKGRVAYEYDWNKSGKNHDDHDDAGSRTAIKYTHHFNEDFAVLGTTEWGYNPFFRHGSDNRRNKLDYFKRLQFAGVSYKGIGTLTYGKQASVYSMVTDATDQYWVFGAAADGKTGFKHLVGADRPDNSLKYQNAFGDVTVGLMFGGNDHDYDDDGSRLTRRHFDQAAVNWQVAPDVTIGTAYNHAAMKDDASDENFNVEQYVVGATWTPGNWTLGVLAGQYHNELAGNYTSARGYETFTQYAFKDLVSFGDVSLYGGLNRLEDRNSPARSSSYIVGTALKTHKGFGANDHFIVALEHVFNDNKNTSGHDLDAEGKNLDQTSLLVRYNY
ncbi:porin [Zymobacter sp. IVIA_5232.4 C2]|uniref:porin n=1 Tax=Zymobacter sp. IVIA_5232.4 C2 TaxID=3394855 RepID=UPI0039C38373